MGWGWTHKTSAAAVPPRAPLRGTSSSPQEEVPPPSPTRGKSRWKRQAAFALAGLAIAMASAGGSAAYLYRKAVAEIGPLSLTDAQKLSTVVVDRDERLLRAFTTDDGRWRLPIEPKDVDQRYLKMLFAFSSHSLASSSFFCTKAMPALAK